MMKRGVSKQELLHYFTDNVGPVFCIPSTTLLHRYPKMEGMVGLIIPFTVNKNIIMVDWSINDNYPAMCLMYKMLTDTSVGFNIDELAIIKPGQDIPQMVDELCSDYRWTPDTRGDVVCIQDFAMKQAHESQASAYQAVRNMIGVVTDKCRDSDDKQLMVTFTKDSWSKIINVPTEFLLRLPKRFKPQNWTMKHNKNDHTAEFEIGDVVRVLPSVADDNYAGLVGVISEVKVDETAINLSPFSYIVDLDTLPNRCLSLTEGEGKVDPTVPVTMKECHIDEWDENVSDRPHLRQFRVHNERDIVWVPSRQKMGRVVAKANSKKSIGGGIALEVAVLSSNNSGNLIAPNIGNGVEKIKMSCRDVDYNWQAEALLSTLQTHDVCLGVEEDNRNPNEVETRAYLYVFTSKDRIGESVQYRILLGSVNPRKSTIRKFGKAIMANKLTHPWQVHRYLQKGTLGLFYELFTANEYLKKVGGFADVAE